MKYIKITPNENGGHQNQFGGGFPGEGWAIIPEDMTIPSTFPFVNIEVEDGVVTSMTEGVVPEPTPIPPVITEIDRLRADVDFIMAMEGYIE